MGKTNEFLKKYLSPKNLLFLVAALLLIVLLYWHFAINKKGFDDLIPNVISDILFAIFVVQFIEYANKRDREDRNRARRRALVRAVQAFYQNLAQTLDVLIADGVASGRTISLPSPEAIIERAKRLNAGTNNVSGFDDDPISFAAFFVCDFTGTTEANVFPRRAAREYFAQLTSRHEELYRDVFYFDNGFLPDELVDVLSSVKNQALFLYGRTILLTSSTRIGYWPEKELRETVEYLSKLQRYFGKELGYAAGDASEIVRNAVVNALAREKRRQGLET